MKTLQRCYVSKFAISAAFLTRNSTEYVSTVEGAIGKGYKICAHKVLETELRNAHPTANWVFSESGNEFYGILDDYDAGNCEVIAFGEVDTRNDIDLMNMFCRRNLTFTKSAFLENVSSSAYFAI